METPNIVVPVCDHSLDDVLVLVSSEIHAIFTDMPVLDFMVTLEFVVSIHIKQEEYYEVYLLLVVYQKKVIYYEVFFISDICKRIGLHQNLIVGGFSFWLCGLSFLTLLFIFLYKT